MEPISVLNYQVSLGFSALSNVSSKAAAKVKILFLNTRHLLKIIFYFPPPAPLPSRKEREGLLLLRYRYYSPPCRQGGVGEGKMNAETLNYNFNFFTLHLYTRKRG
jgi:hypothetical protein